MMIRMCGEACDAPEAVASLAVHAVSPTASDDSTVNREMAVEDRDRSTDTDLLDSAMEGLDEIMRDLQGCVMEPAEATVRAVERAFSSMALRGEYEVVRCASVSESGVLSCCGRQLEMLGLTTAQRQEVSKHCARPYAFIVSKHCARPSHSS